MCMRRGVKSWWRVGDLNKSENRITQHTPYTSRAVRHRLRNNKFGRFGSEDKYSLLVICQAAGPSHNTNQGMKFIKFCLLVYYRSIFFIFFLTESHRLASAECAMHKI